MLSKRSKPPHRSNEGVTAWSRALPAPTARCRRTLTCLTIRLQALQSARLTFNFFHGNRPHRTDPAGDARPAQNLAGCGDGMGARRLRCHALLPGAGLAHARSAYE